MIPHLVIGPGRAGFTVRLGPFALALQFGIVPVIERHGIPDDPA